MREFLKAVAIITVGAVVLYGGAIGADYLTDDVCRGFILGALAMSVVVNVFRIAIEWRR